jgi:hypothetical protein
VRAGTATSPQHDLAGLGAAVPAHVLLGDAATAISGLACDTTLNDVRPGVLFALTPEGRVIVLVGGSDAAGFTLLRQKGEVAALAADYAIFTTQHAHATDPAALVAQLAAGARAAGGVPDAVCTPSLMKVSDCGGAKRRTGASSPDDIWYCTTRVERISQPA